MEKKFTLDWYKELGWKGNPFKVAILTPVAKFYSGYEEERSKINYSIIEKQRFGTISAEEGFGKSALMMWLESQLESHSKTVPVLISKRNINRSEFWAAIINAVLPTRQKILKKTFYKLGLDRMSHYVKHKLSMTDNPNPEESVYKRIFAKKFAAIHELELIAFVRNHIGNRRFILLIDNAAKFPNQLIETIQSLIDAELPMELILADPADHWNVLDLKDELRIKLKGLNYEDSREMIKKRIEKVGGDNIRPFTSQHLMDIVEDTNGCPKKIIEECYDLAVKIALKQVVVKEQRSSRHVPQEESNLAVFDQINESLKGKKEEPPKKDDYEIKVVDHGEDELTFDFNDDIQRVSIKDAHEKKVKKAKKKSVKKRVKKKRSKSS